MSIYSDAVISDAPQAYYRLSEASGSLLDQSGNGNDLVLPFIGASAQRGCGGLLSSDPDGAIQFAGGSYIKAASYSPQALPFTIEGWVRALGAAGIHRWVACAATGNGWSVAISRVTYTSVKDYNFAIGPQTGVVTHNIVIFHADFSVTMILQGGAQQQTVTGTSPMNATASTLQVGASFSGGESWQGWVDEIALYPYELSADRIAAHFAIGSAAVQAGALAGVGGRAHL